MQELALETCRREELVDVTERLQRVVTDSGVREGALLAHVLHTTAAVTINENADPDVVHDLLDALAALAPRDGRYRHTEGNSDAHVKASLVGNSVWVPVSKGRLALGTWQGIYFCEFDGPRRRRLAVQVLGVHS